MAREQQARRVKAKYRTVGPKLVNRIVNLCSLDPETKSLQQVPTEVEELMWTVYFPQGHSIRVTKQELMFHGLHIRPKLVDMDTGEVVEWGGDPYDFMNDAEAVEAEEHKFDVTLTEDLGDEDEQPAKKQAKG